MEPNRTALALALALLAACGGGGSSGGFGVPPPVLLAYPDPDLLVLSGMALAPQAPTFEGPVDTFEVEPALPAGLELDPSTGVLSGVPLAPAARRSFTISAQGAGGRISAAIALEVAAPQRFALVTGAADGTLATFPVDAGSAQFLRGPVSAGPVAGVGRAPAVARPDGRSVYVAQAGTNDLVSWRFDEATGGSQPFATNDLAAGPHALALHASGNWLLVACAGADVVQVFACAGDAAPALAHTVPVGDGPADLSFASDGARVLVCHAGSEATGQGSSLVVYDFDSATGALALVGAPLALNGGRPSALAVDPRAPFVYVTLGMYDAVLAVRTSTAGALTPIPPLRLVGATPGDLEVDARGRFVHVSVPSEDRIRAYAIEPVTGGLALRGDFAAPGEPRALRRDATGERLFVLAEGARELQTYALLPAGALEREHALALRPGSSSLAFVTGAAPLAAAPRLVLCANEDSDDLHAFRVDASTGALTFASQAFTDDRPIALAVDARGDWAVVAAAGARTIQSFRAEQNGALTSWGASVPVPGTPAGLAIEPTGRFVYVATRDVAESGDGLVLTYALDAVNGELEFVDQRPSGASSCAAAVDPTGEFLYLANAGNGTPGSATISAFRLDPATGIPAPVGTTVPAPGIVGLAFHPDGRSVYAVLRGSDALARYAIDRSNGALSVVPPAAGAGFDPAALAVDPRGRFAWASYTGNASSGQIDVLPIEPDGGLGHAIQEVVDGALPVALAVDLSGRFLYAANRASHDVSVLAIEASTGLLEVRFPAAAGTAPSAIAATVVFH
ncbi:MAG: beta-propeller fold lactonase family protein [Planctomycetes bacterium]|nr:beta-propeller fold lactonase family protein [Planctomycetota bacterium]